MNRQSGILMPISSLPSNHGIGTFGRAAYDFADFLKLSGQKIWQILPLGPTSYGDSPYMSLSTHAGNPYFVDLDMLAEEGYLKEAEIAAADWGSSKRYVDYGKIYENRFEILALAKDRAWEKEKDKIAVFRKDNDWWLDEYTLFMALKRHFGMVSWTEWPDSDARLHKDAALVKYRELLREDIELFTFIQYEFFSQWKKLKSYVNGLGIKFVGDIPIYVALDSADVWSEPEWFELDEDNYPVRVSGVPPDYFCEDGQLWGNPLYRWDVMAKDGYGWWIRRLDSAHRLYDIIRIDHFRGFDSYWAVPYGKKTARIGEWVKGPGMDFVGKILRQWFYGKEYIAEDLGDIGDSVEELLKESGYPGMKVLEFAFDSGESKNYQPHSYTDNCVCYTGTHDNSPVMEWEADAKPSDVRYARTYLGVRDDETLAAGFIRSGMRSVAGLFVAQMQDYLELGKGHRINMPGIAQGNWRWRMLKGEADKKLAKRILALVKMYER